MTLVGRRREVAELVARAGRAGQVVVVTGPAGVGKSALVAEALAASPGASAVLTGRSVPASALPLRPLSELAVAALAAGGRLDDPRLAPFLPALDLLLGRTGTAPARAEPGLAFGLMVAEVVAGLAASLGAQATAPCVLVLEDLHWADPETMAALDHLADRVRGRPASLVLIARDDSPAAAEVLNRLVASSRASAVRLAGLGPADQAELAAEILGGPAPGALLDHLAARAEGLPLAVQELIAGAEASGHLRRDGGGWTFDTTGDLPAPPSVIEAVARRLDRLDPATRDLVVALALTGGPILLDTARRVLDQPMETLISAVGAAQAVGLMSGGSPGPDGRIQLRHDSIGTAVRAGFDRARAAAAADAAVARLGPPAELSDPELEVAVALAGSGTSPGHRADLLAEAGSRALRRGSPASAAELLEQAVSSDPLAPVAGRRRLQLVEALALAGRLVEAERLGHEVRAELTLAGAAPGVADLDCALARVELAQGRHEAAAARLAAVPPHGLAGATAAALAATIALEQGRAAEADALARTALDRAAGLDAPAVVCEAHEVLGRLARSVDLDEAERRFRLAVAAATGRGLALWRARALHELATIAQLRRCEVDALEEAHEAALAAGAVGLAARVEFHLAALHGIRFEAGPALEHARALLDHARWAGNRHLEAWAWVLIGQAHAVAGARARADAAALDALALAGDDLELRGMAIGGTQALAGLVVEDRPAAVAGFREAISLLRQAPTRSPLPPWYLWPLLVTVDDPGSEEAAAARAETDAAELMVVPGHQALWLLAGAVAAGHRGDRAAADALVARAEVVIGPAPGFRPLWRLGLRLAAERALADGWGAPETWLGDAAAWAEAAGLDRLAVASRTVLRRAGVRVRRAGRGATPVPEALRARGVTSREMDVLVLVADGLTNAEIADRLYVSAPTVKTHVEHLLAKTGARNRSELTALAVREQET